MHQSSTSLTPTSSLRRTKKALLARLNSFFAMLPLLSRAYNHDDINSIYIQSVEPPSKGNGDKKEKPGNAKEKFELVRHVEGKPSKDIIFELDFWGRCVDATTAATIQRHLVLPIYCKEGLYPHSAYGDLELYLAGDQCGNTQRSDACLAYMIKPIAADKTQEGFTEEVVPIEADVRESAADKIKRQKLMMRNEEKKLKLPTITHRIEYVDFSVDAPSAGSKEIVTYHFQRPKRLKRFICHNVNIKLSRAPIR